MFLGVWLANTQIQIHKYANTALVKVADRHGMCYILYKVMVRGPQKQCSLVSDFQIHKYANTALIKVADRHEMCYIFEKGTGKRTSETMFPGVWLANTQTQIHKYPNT